MVRSASARAEGCARPDRATVAYIDAARAGRYDRLRQLLMAVAEWDFHKGRLAHARYWLGYLREQRVELHRRGCRHV